MSILEDINSIGMAIENHNRLKAGGKHDSGDSKDLKQKLADWQERTRIYEEGKS